MNKAVNYNHYNPKAKDYIYILIRAILIDFVIVYLFYKNMWVCMAVMPVCYYASYKLYISAMISRRKRRLESEFEELLGCISSLLSAGYSLENAVFESRKELLQIYERDSLIIHELNLMCFGIDMNKPVELLFQDLAARSDITDIITFAEMISISKRSGGDMIAIVRQTIDVIHNRHEVNNEINTMIAAKKYENRIMNLMPLGMIVFMSVFSPGYLDVLYNNVFGAGLMTICLAVYGGSWLIGAKIMAIDTGFADGMRYSRPEGKNVNKNMAKSLLFRRILSRTFLKKSIESFYTKFNTLYGELSEVMFGEWVSKLWNTMLILIPACTLLTVYAYINAHESLAYMLLIIGAVIFGVPYMSVSKVSKQLKKRREQLMLDYPEMINRFILLLGSGINMRAAWERMCKDYSMKKEKSRKIHYIYEEMISTVNDMVRGIPEAEAYERFGRRLQLLPYMKLSAMLSQNLKKGNKRMIEQLRLTSIDALIQRRDTMKQLGEEASSKLLFPMMLQFMLILIIVMVPAIRTM